MQAISPAYPLDFQFARFRLSSLEFGIDVKNVKEIIKPRDAVRDDEMPGFIEGFIRLRSIAVPLIDLRKRFSLDAEAGKETRIIIASLDGRIAGILVDEVNDIAAGGKEVSLRDNLKEGPWSPCVDGAIDTGKGVVMILNLSALLTEDEKKRLGDPMFKKAAQCREVCGKDGD